MSQYVSGIRLLVQDYDEAIDFYVDRLGFTLVEDTALDDQGKRWVTVAPPGSRETRLLLAKAADRDERGMIGCQSGGRVFLFLTTDNLKRDYERYKRNDIVFVREPVVQPYGTVAVFRDLYGNLWDLIQPAEPAVSG
ncbi:VOC family protein [Acanthopleuribacter pedis]|uniref:VOC family protein n=1 Tax=Acanthopleuribacter pedis TaxID=442870 RepID=A0A8J7QD71_9BACT|nr:VOC family protein [Acanthopleuribacter pedis]MBO1317435.1 VOC family protein [Acanthopleuribacter pedis]